MQTGPYQTMHLLRLKPMQVMLAMLLPGLSGCAEIDVKRMTYEILASEDCRRNQLEDFCARSYTHEYHAYERLRQEYLRTSDNDAIRQTHVTQNSKEISSWHNTPRSLK